MSSTFDTPARPRRGNGITTPTRRGGSGRMLSDVIVDLGFVDRGTMDLAIERGTEHGHAPERVLVPDGNLTDEQLSAAPSPSASASTTSISRSTASIPTPPSSSRPPPSAATRPSRSPSPAIAR